VVALRREERALTFIKEGAPAQSSEELAERYLLVLYLARKRILLFRKDVEFSGDRFSLFEVAETEEILPIRKVKLDGSDLERMQLRIAKQLSSDS
jgi:hypothetical protein